MPTPESRISNLEPRLFVLVAGEASGDLLGADLIAGLRRRFPGARFAGVGGPSMHAAGMEIWYPAERLAVMGLVEVLRHLPQLLALRRDVFRRTLAAAPAAFVGIDAPDFNLGLERRLRRAGVRTVHYVSPSVWAWREKRVERIGRSADCVLCLFPMEPPIYARHGVDARFVGHPLADVFAGAADKASMRREFGLPADAPVLALLPGSRLSEIRRLGADFIEAVRRLRSDFPDLQVIAPMANAQCAAAFRQVARAAGFDAADARSGIRIVAAQSAPPSAATGAHAAAAHGTHVLGPSHRAMLAADAVLLASGTAALEAMLAKRPMVVAYRVAPLTYRIVKLLRLLRTSVYSLPNILAGRRLVPELMQDDCTPRALAAALAPALRTRALDAPTRAEFDRLQRALCTPAAGAAGAVADVLASRS